jgi:hypothetical protein
MMLKSFTRSKELDRIGQIQLFERSKKNELEISIVINDVNILVHMQIGLG